jgi:adenine-specific DNA-methyltransferase
MDNDQNITLELKAQNNNLEALKKHFPQCFLKDGSFDFDKFKQELSENEIDFYKESYGLDWLGKSYARVLATDSVSTLLKEDVEFNQKPENKDSQNILIKGDNLEVLKHLSHAYYEKVKMIYIDPPYNTGGDGFVYQDDRKFTVEELQKLAGVSEEKAKRILDFTQSKSNSHSAWLTFMYPRLYVARQLLKDEGVIFISIDDNEVSQLRILCDEVFGEENFLGLFIVNSSPSGIDYGHVAKTNDYALFYSKHFDFTKTNLIEEKDKKFSYNDEKGGFNLAPLYNGNVAFNPQTRPNLFYPFYLNPNNNISEDFFEIDIESNPGWVKVLPVISKKDGVQRVWRWGKPKAKENLNREIVGYKNKEGSFRIVQKNRLYSKMIRTLLLENEYSSRRGTSEIETLFNKKVFSYPKPVELLKLMLQVGSESQDIILDFFAGSGTTGDAVMQLNAKDGGHRQFILAQLPEPLDPKKDKVAYDFVKSELGVETPTIFEITKERLIRAAQKTKDENPDITNQDLGFKIFETTPIWDDYHFDEDEFHPQVTMFDENPLLDVDIQSLFLTWKTYDGSPLTEQYQQYCLDGYNGYYVNNKLYLMDKGFKTDHLKSLLENIDSDKEFNPTSVIAFGYNFESKSLREISENIKSYANKKNIDIDFITRY